MTQQANVVLVDVGKFAFQIFAEQAHQEIDFGLGAAPIFQGEGVEREARELQAGAGFDDVARGFTPARCPATRGRWRRCAQRPLPSMMTATCSGRRFRSSLSRSSASSRLAALKSSLAFTQIRSRTDSEES